MKRSFKSRLVHKQLFFVTVIALLFMPLSAQAYLDPTTGSMLISAIVGLFASLVLALKTYWYRIKAFFRRKPTESDPGDGAS
jgi:hypothetical protein